MTRKRLYDIIEASDHEDKLSAYYDRFMIVVIIASLIPLIFKEDILILTIVDLVAVTIFIIDYVLRLITADFKYNKKSVTSFLRYPFSPMAIIDVLSILPSLIMINPAWRVLRMLRLLRILRVFKFLHYSKSVRILMAVFKKSVGPLKAVLGLALGYILVCALIVFNVEPNSFETFFDAVYWATVSLTTMGYGDLYPITDIGRVVTMFSALFGIAIVALPAGIITAGYMTEIERQQNNPASETDTDTDKDEPIN